MLNPFAGQGSIMDFKGCPMQNKKTKYNVHLPPQIHARLLALIKAWYAFREGPQAKKRLASQEREGKPIPSPEPYQATCPQLEYLVSGLTPKKKPFPQSGHFFIPTFLGGGVTYQNLEVPFR